MLYVVTIGLSAFLLFLVQPMLSKQILPFFGGGASVWIASLIFYQTLLLVGYAISHLLARMTSVRQHRRLQAGLLLLSLCFLPLAARTAWIRPQGFPPFLGVLLLLAVSVGVPYLVLATTSPTLQHWMTTDPKAGQRSPYVQYAVSNAGSLTGLLLYPLFLEVHTGIGVQTVVWSVGFLLFVGLALWVLYHHAQRAGDRRPIPAAESEGGEKPKGTLSDRMPLNWMGLAFVPSAALVVITHHLTVDVVNFPFLWVLPLAVYLISFVGVFLLPGLSEERPLRTLLVLLPIVGFTLSIRGELDPPLWAQVGTACLALLAICLYFHGNLEREKPPPSRLTAFYLYLSLGAGLGSISVGIVAPLCLRSTWELLCVCLVATAVPLLPRLRGASSGLRRVLGLLFVGLLLFTYVTEEWTYHSGIVHRVRSFYGAYRIREVGEREGRVAARLLLQGTTIHGGQARDEKGDWIPVAYYHERSLVGQTLRKFPELRRIGAVGLGTGVISIYGRPSQRFDFFEIDPANIRMARRRFDLLRTSRAEIRCVAGDGRLELQNVPDDTYDLLVLDAFSSGAIPTHLLTVEAVRDYLRVCRDDGLLLFHISNRHVDLWPVLNGVGRELGLQRRRHVAEGDERLHKFEATWVVMTRSRRRIEKLIRGPGRFESPPGAILWTDEKTTLWPVLRWAGTP